MLNRQNSVLFVFLFIKQTLGKILHGIQGSFKNLFPLPFQPFCRYPPQPIIIVVTNGFLHYTEIFIKALCTMPKNVFIGNGFLGMRSSTSKIINRRVFSSENGRKIKRIERRHLHGRRKIFTVDYY